MVNKTTFAFAGSTGVPNDVQSLISTSGWQRQSDLVQTSTGIVKFDNIYMIETKPLQDKDGTVTMPDYMLQMEGKVQSLHGQFPDGITSVTFPEGKQPSVTFGYVLNKQETAYLSAELNGRFGINDHIKEEPYQLPIQHTTDFYPTIDKNGNPATLLNVNVVEAHNTELNSIDMDRLGESLIVSEFYQKALPKEMADERIYGLYEAQKEEAILEAADKKAKETTPVQAANEGAALTSAEIMLNQQSAKVQAYVDDVMAQRESIRQQHIQEAEAQRQAEEEIKKQAEADARAAEDEKKRAIAEAEEQAAIKAAEEEKAKAANANEPKAATPDPSRFNTDRLAQMLGQFTDQPSTSDNYEDDFV